MEKHDKLLIGLGLIAAVVVYGSETIKKFEEVVLGHAPKNQGSSVHDFAPLKNPMQEMPYKIVTSGLPTPQAPL